MQFGKTKWLKMSQLRYQELTAKQKKLGLKTVSDLQNWFLNEVSEGLRKRNIRSIAWGEHIEGGVPKGQIVHAWLGSKDLEAVKLGHSVVNSVNGFFYLDYPAHGKELDKYGAWMRGLRLPTKKIYNYEPVPAHFTPKEQARIIGVEAPLWTETVKMDRVDKMVFPRILATAESAWTSKANKSWPSFQQRFAVHRSVLDSKDIQYDKQDIIVTGAVVAQWTAQTTPAQFTKLKFDVSKYIKKEGSYKFKLEYQSGRHALKIKSLSLSQSGEPIAIDKHLGVTGGDSHNNIYTCVINKMSKKPVYLEMIIKGDGGTDSSGSVTLEK